MRVEAGEVLRLEHKWFSHHDGAWIHAFRRPDGGVLHVPIADAEPRPGEWPVDWPTHLVRS